MRELIMPLSTGLAIFLFGMQVMRIGFEHLFLKKTKKALTLLTKNTLSAFLIGVLVTALLQSSSAVSLITIGLAHSRVLRLKDALAIILGANIGTCLTTELIAFDIQYIGLPCFILGAGLFLWPRLFVKALGLALGGFGLLFIGMETMQSILPVLKHADWLETSLGWGIGAGIRAEIGSEIGIGLRLENLLKGIISGTLLTAIIQSSTATTALTMNLINEQLISLQMAIAIVLGSNIGTCMTAILGSIGANKSAKQVALAHVLLNVCGVILFLPLIPLLSQVVQSMSHLPMQQVAHAQTIFNLICSLAVLPFIQYFERLIMYISHFIFRSQ